MDELKLQVASKKTKKPLKNSCILLFLKSWLHSSILYAAMKLWRCTGHWHDRTHDSVKSRGVGLCIYVKSVNSHCSPDLKYMMLNAGPYSVQELAVVIVMALYIPQDANTSLPLRHLHNTVSKQMTNYPENVHIVAGGLIMLIKSLSSLNFTSRWNGQQGELTHWRL